MALSREALAQQLGAMMLQIIELDAEVAALRKELEQRKAAEAKPN